jgi:hypothetical protein
VPASLQARSRAIATVLGVLALGALAPAAASAATHNPRGRLLGAASAAGAGGTARRAAPLTAESPLAYHGGPVVHDGHVYAIFWEPPGYSFPPDYKAAVARFFTRVAADSGKRTNVYSVNRQYPDRTGPPPYRVAFQGSFTDTSFLPSSGCANPATDVCLTDGQLSSELTSFVLGHGLPRGLGRQYFLFTAPGVGSCFDASSSDCAFADYCAYHSFVEADGVLLYAAQPYVTASGTCDVGQSPTGTSADAVLNVASHEHNEIITDPIGTAWFDSDGDENGDKCAWHFGDVQGGAGTFYNQLIGGAPYLLQLEWSNADGGCAARIPNRRPVAAYVRSGRAVARHALRFDASRASDPDGRIVSYRWDFGDGAHARGRVATHAYAHRGAYRIRLTVTDDEGATATKLLHVAVAARHGKHRKPR